MKVAGGPVTATKAGMLVCVNSHTSGELGGILYSQLLPEPLVFQNIVQLTGSMDATYDAYSFPQGFLAKRTFGNGTSYCQIRQKEGIGYMPHETVMAAQGLKGTFLVNVLFRQNATWQGTISWVEQNKKQHFRSALEMIKLMDEALTNAGETNPISWEEMEPTQQP